MSRITPFLWFNTEAEEAATFYTSLFPNSRIVEVQRHETADAEKSAFVVTFEIDGMRFTALNGAPGNVHFTDAVSFQVDCADQAEVDRYWDALIADGGEPSQCGWLKDRFGVSWQIIPTALPRLLADPDRQAAARVMNAMLGMQRIDIAALEAAKSG
ncbi:VOC family protein [Luedemannella helvata]|uniref:VOC family protein n=1 Tax=Luedemannella helvata TaxID=349315 RepID=A0ABN2K644_9ACTN